MEKNFDEAYRIFSRVMMIYPLKKLKDMVNLNTGYEIEDIIYLNPKEIEKESYKVIIKNNILTIKNYHENIRFVIREKDLLTIKNIFEKKGYSDYLQCLIEVLKKSSSGMSVISGKKINSIFSACDIDNAYNLGHEEKFLFFKYRINIDTFPPFFISLIMHEAVIEYLKEEFINVVRLDLPYLSFIKYFSQSLITYFNSALKDKYFFYPEDIRITEYVSLRQYGLNKYARFLFNNNGHELIIYFFYSKEFEKTINAYSAEGFDPERISEYYNEHFNENIMKGFNFSVFKKDPAEEQNAGMESVLISYKFSFLNDFHKYNIAVIFPLSFFNDLIRIIFKTDKKITFGNIKEHLSKINEYLEKYKSVNIKDFNYKERRELKLDALKEEQPKPFLKTVISTKRIKTAEEIVQVDDKIIQLAVGKMKPKELEIIIKSSSAGIKGKILNNLSKKTREFYLEELKIKKEYNKYEIKAYITKFINVINNINLQ